MQVLLHISPFAHRGGCEMNCLRVVEALPEYHHQIVVCDRIGPLTHMWRSVGAKVEHLELWNGNAFWFARGLAAWTRSRVEHPAGIFLWSTSRLPFVLNCLAGLACPVVVHVGNPLVLSRTTHLRLAVYEWLFTHSSRVHLVACSKHVAESHRCAPYFRRFAQSVIYNPVTAQLGRPRVYRQLPLGIAPVVGMVARLDPIKDHATVLRAMASLIRQRPDVTVEFAGGGRLRAILESAAQRLGVAKHVRFLGEVEDVASLLRRWDIFVYSTTENEGMGNALAEALMAGIPCLVCDLPVMREVGGPNGAVYFPAGDAAALAREVFALIGNAEKRAALGAEAQKVARLRFEARSVAESYLAACGVVNVP
jgi:glycosyltransferase involved in cell wall biosynthesis